MKKLRVFTVITVLVFLISYITYSTFSIDAMSYRSIVWEAMSTGRFFRVQLQDSWMKGSVILVNLKNEKYFSVGHRSWNKLNYYLNMLNGGYAVSVTFSILGNNMNGPYTTYVNPFTKQIIGAISVID